MELQKENKTRTICMVCLHSVITEKHTEDPLEARIIITDSCPKCDSESGETLFFDYRMNKIEPIINTHQSIEQ